MAYVKNSNATAARSSYAGNKPATAPSSKPKMEEKEEATHSLSIRVGEGDAVEFISVGNLWTGKTKDGRSMYKGSPYKIKLLAHTEDGRQLDVQGFFVTAKN
jgi:hypothetical protein